MFIKKVRPMLNHIITTANVYTDDQSGDIIEEDKAAGNFKEYQTIVAVGPNVNHLKPGDVVLINPRAYIVPVHKSREDSVTGLMNHDTVEEKVAFPILDINNEPHLFIYDRDVDLVLEDFDESDGIVEANEIVE